MSYLYIYKISISSCFVNIYLDAIFSSYPYFFRFYRLNSVAGFAIIQELISSLGRYEYYVTNEDYEKIW